MKLIVGLASSAIVAMGGGAFAQPAPAPNPIGVVGVPRRPGPRIPDVVAPSVPEALALEAAKAAVEACSAFHISVTILDAAGLPKLDYMPDGTAGSHAATATRKARTALLIHAPSETILEVIKTDPAISGEVTGNANYIFFAGGLPIMSGGRLLGAIGVSGAEPSAKDEACAATALARIQPSLE